MELRRHGAVDGSRAGAPGPSHPGHATRSPLSSQIRIRHSPSRPACWNRCHATSPTWFSTRSPRRQEPPTSACIRRVCARGSVTGEPGVGPSNTSRLRAEDEQTTIEHECRDAVDAERAPLRSTRARGRRTSPASTSSTPLDRGASTASASVSAGSPMLHPSSQYASMSRSCTALWFAPRARAPSRAACFVFGTISQVVDEPVRLEHPAHALDARLAVARERSRSRGRPPPVLGMKVEREPRDLRAEPALEPVGRRLADAAERSDVVGPDEDFVLAHPAPAAGGRRPSRGCG